MKRTSKDGYEYYALNEVYYNTDISLKAYSEYDDVVGDSPAEIIAILQMMLKDARKDVPILTKEDFIKVDNEIIKIKESGDLETAQYLWEQLFMIEEGIVRSKY